jgi:hypothetical protein
MADGALTRPVVLVLEGQARTGAEEGTADGVEVVHAPGLGDDTLVAVAAESEGPVVLVSADRGLAERVRRSGAEVVGPTWLLDRLDRLASGHVGDQPAGDLSGTPRREQPRHR